VGNCLASGLGNYVTFDTPLETQQEVVGEIEAEQALVGASRGLIERLEQRIRSVLLRLA